ncbi:Arc family DNA-binding protein [Methylobacterium sp. WL6]|uniref:Arc family DNA-binding protein n=1 Tax=Methylobacterium sp. WL6 TaxID=2603901 RepID=UPI0011C7A356|nr:Arc family DNA-binding protein [Methylobacterium sp. WL6]TXN71470.1 Arc family DNA-binding protein [Methylobacterium sp. WL6]
MTDDAAAKRSKGRPRIYPGTEKRPTLTFRVRGGLHEQLKEAAEKNERSLSEEIEGRVAMSFEPSRDVEHREDEYERLLDYLGGKDRIWFLFIISNSFGAALDEIDPGRQNDIDWTKSSKKIDRLIDFMQSKMQEIVTLAASQDGRLAKSIARVYQGTRAHRAMRQKQVATENN